MGFPADETFYSNPTRTSHKEDTMTIPTTTDLLNATDKDGWDLGDRIESSLGVILDTFLDGDQLDTCELANALTNALLDEIRDTDLNAYAHQKEA